MPVPGYYLRAEIAQDTVARSEAITREHAEEGATTDSTFITEDLLTKELQTEISAGNLKKLDSKSREPVRIINGDSFTVARSIMDEFPEESKGKVAVLNLASDEMPGGGWIETLYTTQEEALCYSSTLYATLKPSYYPWPNLGPGSVAGIFSPGVVIFKDDLDHGCVNLQLEARRVVSVITVAAPRLPDLTRDGLAFANESDLNDLRGKIRLVYRMGVRYQQRFLVLGAMGCGVFMCPSRVVAEEMRNILLEPEFEGWFRKVVFAVYSKPGTGEGNFQVFEEVFKDVVV